VARYTIGWTATGVSNSALAWLRSTAARDMRVWEIGVFEESGTAAATVIGLGRPAAVSATPTALVPQAEDSSAGAASCSAAVAATTKPTSPAVFMRRFGMPATLGAGVIWTFPMGLVVPTGPAELVVWNIGAATCVFGGYFVYEE
jgi:coproporphyrinogen III oxidase